MQKKLRTCIHALKYFLTNYITEIFTTLKTVLNLTVTHA